MRFDALFVRALATGLPSYAAQRIVATLVKLTDSLAVETLVSDVHPRAEPRDSGKFFDREADGLSSGGKTSIAERSPGAFRAFHKQFSR